MLIDIGEIYKNNKLVAKDIKRIDIFLTENYKRSFRFPKLFNNLTT